MNWYCRIKSLKFSFFSRPEVSSDGNLLQPVASAPSRVAAVGPYIQSSTMPRIASRPELLVKPAFSDGTQALQVPDGPLKTQTLPNMRAGNSSQAKAPAGNSLQLIFLIQTCFVFLSNSSVLTLCFSLSEVLFEMSVLLRAIFPAPVNIVYKHWGSMIQC